jgi:hypothetical protein
MILSAVLQKHPSITIPTVLYFIPLLISCSLLSPQFASSSQTVHLIPLGNKLAIQFLVWYLVPLRIVMLT